MSVSWEQSGRMSDPPPTNPQRPFVESLLVWRPWQVSLVPLNITTLRHAFPHTSWLFQSLEKPQLARKLGSFYECKGEFPDWGLEEILFLPLLYPSPASTSYSSWSSSVYSLIQRRASAFPVSTFSASHLGRLAEYIVVNRAERLKHRLGLKWPVFE